MSSRLALAGALALLASGCGGSGSHHRHPAAPAATTTAAKATATAATTNTSATAGNTAAPRPRARPKRFKPIAILPAAHRAGRFGWREAAAVRGVAAVWITRVAAFREPAFTVTLLRLNQHLATLTLHAGSTQPGGSGWRYGSMVGARERRRLLAGFNSAFEESYGAGGFVQDGRVGWRLRRGRASVVVYRDGTADIGAWRAGVPAPGRPVASVRQNLELLIDHGVIARNVDTCIRRCWGDPLHERPVVARSGLGVTAQGDLLWAAGPMLSVRALAEALASHGAVRAMELDINPAWVAGYLYAHERGIAAVSPVALMPGQADVDSAFLGSYYRDFFTVLAR